MCPEYGNRHPQPPCLICPKSALFERNMQSTLSTYCRSRLKSLGRKSPSLSYFTSRILRTKLIGLHYSKMTSKVTSFSARKSLLFLSADSLLFCDLKSLRAFTPTASLQPLRASHKSACARASLRSCINKTTARFITKSAVATKREPSK